MSRSYGLHAGHSSCISKVLKICEKSLWRKHLSAVPHCTALLSYVMAATSAILAFTGTLCLQNQADFAETWEASAEHRIIALRSFGFGFEIMSCFDT